MNQPKIEYKNRRARPRQDTPISLLETKLRKGEQKAREMLSKLETALVNCGYVRDGIYNSRQARFSGYREHATVLLWEHGKILLGRGLEKGPDGKAKRPYQPKRPVSVMRMNGHQLARVAVHLAPFIDALENNVRHQLEAMERSLQTMQSIIDHVEKVPNPSEEPTQMSQDLDVEVPEDPEE